MTTQNSIHLCSFCSHKIKFQIAQEGKRAKCPKCAKVIRLFSNLNRDIRPLLSSEWFVKVPKKLILSETLGPMSEGEFAKLYSSGRLTNSCEIRSRRFTNDQWVIFDSAIMQFVIEEAGIKAAENARITERLQKKEEINKENMSRLRRFVQQAVSDGELDSTENSAIESFAVKAKLNLDEVKRMVHDESQQIVKGVLADALADGVLAPDEEEKLNRFLNGLGIALNPSPEEGRQIVLSRFAYELNMRDENDHPTVEMPFALNSKERGLASDVLEWNEVVRLKKPKGIALGNDRYLKQITLGNCYLTTKRLYVESNFESKKVTLSSVQKVEIYCDGIFLNRSTGKSLFLKFAAEDSIEHLKFGVFLKRLISGLPVQGFLPNRKFVPEQEIVASLDSEPAIVSDHPTNSIAQYEPRFTFRVVGNHIGDRSFWIQKLKAGDSLAFVREPKNPVDHNAVIVVNDRQKVLGYLKAEVAAWFGPLLDSKKRFSVSVLRIRSDNSLIVAVFE